METLKNIFKNIGDMVNQVDVHISTNAEHGGVYIIDKHYNSYEHFIDCMYDICKVCDINLIGHDPRDGLMTTFYFQDLADAYAFDIILRGRSTEQEFCYLTPINESIPLSFFAQSIEEHCKDNDIRIAQMSVEDKKNCIYIVTDGNIAMSSILQAYKKGIFDFLSIQKMELNSVEHVLHMDLPRPIIDMTEFEINFIKICTEYDIHATFAIDTPYSRRLRVTTNEAEHIAILQNLHAHGMFNVGLHHKKIEFQPMAQ